MTRRWQTLPRRIRRFAGDEDGVALVEFAIALPLFLILFAATVDGARMMWSYQQAVAGVRDATRYLSRVAASDVCPGGSLAGFSDNLARIVENSVTGETLTPGGVTIVSVVPALTCPAGTYRNGPVSIASVTATVRITMPLSTVFQLIDGQVGTFDAVITDSTRIFGT